MTYQPNTPHANDIPAIDSQEDFLTNFGLLNSIFRQDHIPFGNSISGATRAAPCVITSPSHRLNTGDSVDVLAMKGKTADGVIVDWSINGTNFNVTVIDANRFSLDGSNTTAEQAYISNSGIFDVTATADPNLPYPYGFHKKIGFINPLNSNPNLSSPFVSLFVKSLEGAFFTKEKVQGTGGTSIFTDKLQMKQESNLFFQNQNTNASAKNLTGNALTYNPNPLVTFYSLNTVFDLKLNFGRVRALTTNATVITLPLTYTTTHFTTIMTANLFSSAQPSSIKVTALGLNSFTYQRGVSAAGFEDYNFISIGR